MSTEPIERRFFLKEYPLSTRLAFGMLIGYAVILIWDQSGWWLRDEEYHFGFLVPLFVAFVWMERRQCFASLLAPPDGAHPNFLEPEPSLWDSSPVSGLLGAGFVLLLLGSMMFFLFGGVVRLAEGGLSVPSTLLFSIGFGGMLISLPYVFLDKDTSGAPLAPSRRLRMSALLLFPAFVWLLASPMPGFLKQEIQLFLLEKVVWVVYFSFEFFGYPLIREGNTFVLPEGRVGVVDACSGIRSLTGCVVTGAFLAAVFLKKLYLKLILLFAAVVLAVVSNLARSLFLTAYAYRHGGDAISGWIHDVSGYAVLGLTALGLWLLVVVMTLGDRDWSRAFDADKSSS